MQATFLRLRLFWKPHCTAV